VSLFSLCKIKPEVWHDINRIPVFPRRVNRWLLATRAFDERPTNAELFERARQMLNFFGLTLKGPDGKAIFFSQPRLVEREVKESWGKPIVEMRSTVPNLTMAPGLVTLYAVEFVPGGDLLDDDLQAGWPTMPSCPFDATDAAFAVFAPGGVALQTPTSPDEQVSQDAREAAEAVTDPIVETLEDLGQGASELAKSALPTLLWGAFAASAILWAAASKGRR